VSASSEALSGPQLSWSGPELRSTLRVLACPGILGLLVIAGIQLPLWVLYVVASSFALVVAVRSLWDPEWLLASFILYLPLSRVFPVEVAPQVNGTSLLYAALMLAWVFAARREGRTVAPRAGIKRLVALYLVITALAIIPTIATIGLEATREVCLEKYKSWLEQLVGFFIVLGLIRDGRMARRVVIYLIIGTVIALLFGAQEMLGKLNASSIENSRVAGPQYQPNEFGAFIVSNMMILLAVAALAFPRVRVLWLVPGLLLCAKLLTSTFSRGAELGVLAGAVLISVLRGRAFLFSLAAAGILAFTVFPGLLPKSVVDRFDETNVQDAEGDRLDKSSADRLILWQAALQMTSESPVLGKGFGMFPILKDQYTPTPVPVSDTHNMYFFISTQMGVPALLIYIAILLSMLVVGYRVYRRHPEFFARCIGLGCAGMAVSWMVMNMFGSRMVAVETSGFFWIYLAVLAYLDADASAAAKEPLRLGQGMRT
jgi:putative inorganic carbon (hco3(-)) transporter